MEAQEAIERGIEAARAGNQRTAYYYFNAATRADPTSEQAWLWRASAAPRPEEALNCLAAVLALNPDNPVARHGLEQISAAVAATRDQEPEAITPSRVVHETRYQPPERRLEWQQTFQRDHYDAGRVVHLAAPGGQDRPASDAEPPRTDPAIAALLMAPDRPEAGEETAVEPSVLQPVGHHLDGVRRSLVERNAQRRRIMIATAVPVALIIVLVIAVGLAQYPAQGATPAPPPPRGVPPTPTVAEVVPPPPENPTATTGVPIGADAPTPAPPPPAETDTPAPPPPAETDTPAPPPPAETDTPAPPPPAQDTPAPPSGEQTYTVAPGDTLSSIAGKFGVSLAALMVTNNLTHPFDAAPGQQLKIPPADFHPTELTHRVLPGETLSGIAALYGADPAAITARNGLSNPNQVFAGQELIIPLP